MSVARALQHTLLVDARQPAKPTALENELQIYVPQLEAPQPSLLQQSSSPSRALQPRSPQTETTLLPYGPTLHYPDCGCPHDWQPGQLRICDHVDLLVQNAFLAFQKGSLAPTRKLRIAYMLPHHNVTGGMKCLVEHIRLLRARGHTTIAVHRSNSASRAMPPWTADEADVDIILKLHERLHHKIPAAEIDVVVVGIFHQVGRSDCSASLLLVTRQDLEEIL